MGTPTPVEFTQKIPGYNNRNVGNHVVLTDENDVVHDGSNPLPVSDVGSNLTIQRAIISASTNGNNTIVAAVGGQKIKVLGLFLIAAGDVDVRFESGADGTALTGVVSLATDGNGFVLPVSSPGKHWIETAAGVLLNLELSANIQVSGAIIYYTEA